MCSASTELYPTLALGVLHTVTYPHGLDSGCVFQGISAALQQARAWCHCPPGWIRKLSAGLMPGHAAVTCELHVLTPNSLQVWSVRWSLGVPASHVHMHNRHSAQVSSSACSLIIKYNKKVVRGGHAWLCWDWGTCSWPIPWKELVEALIQSFSLSQSRFCFFVGFFFFFLMRGKLDASY